MVSSRHSVGASPSGGAVSTTCTADTAAGSAPATASVAGKATRRTRSSQQASRLRRADLPSARLGAGRQAVELDVDQAVRQEAPGRYGKRIHGGRSVPRHWRSVNVVTGSRVHLMIIGQAAAALQAIQNTQPWRHGSRVPIVANQDHETHPCSFGMSSPLRPSANCSSSLSGSRSGIRSGRTRRLRQGGQRPEQAHVHFKAAVFAGVVLATLRTPKSDHAQVRKTDFTKKNEPYPLSLNCLPPKNCKFSDQIVLQSKLPLP